MKVLIVVMFLLGVAYAWFMFYEPKPSLSSMQGVISEFQQCIMRGDVNGMRRLCSSETQDDCDRLLEQIRDAEGENGTTLDRVGSLNFDYTRGAHRVEGMVSGTDYRGETLFSSIVAVEQRTDGGPWQIVVIH